MVLSLKLLFASTNCYHNVRLFIVRLNYLIYKLIIFLCNWNIKQIKHIPISTTCTYTVKWYKASTFWNYLSVILSACSYDATRFICSKHLYCRTRTNKLKSWSKYFHKDEVLYRFENFPKFTHINVISLCEITSVTLCVYD